MKQAAICALLVFAALFSLGACASQNSLSPEQSASGTTVPGEKVSGDGGVTPGAGPSGASANVKW